MQPDPTCTGRTGFGAIRIINYLCQVAFGLMPLLQLLVFKILTSTTANGIYGIE